MVEVVEEGLNSTLFVDLGEENTFLGELKKSYLH